MKIKTNNQPRLLCDFNEVPEAIRQSEFDYLEADTMRSFFKYRGVWYDLSEFTTITPDTEVFKGWDGYAPDSFFSGVVVKLVDNDPDYVIVGTYFN